MTDNVTNRLYNLLPAIYRIRDSAEGLTLQALFAVFEEVARDLEADITGLYDNWFIETCDEWVVPYIGDLLRLPGMHPGSAESFSLRAYVANLLAYRRRKGTATVLEQVVRDASGWPARVVEFPPRLATTQQVNHVRASSLAILNVRDSNALELLNGPFENATHTVDVRRITSGRGRYNLPNVGIFVWRLQSYAVTRGEARAIGCRCYTFNPLGLSQPLFNRPQTETTITHLSEELNVPGPLRRRPLYDELQQLRQALAQNQTPKALYFGRMPVFQIYLDGEQVPTEDIAICDLQKWDRMAAVRSALAASAIAVGVDPLLGRLICCGEKAPELVKVSYAYGFSGDIGGGPYNRALSLTSLLQSVQDLSVWQGYVTKQQTAEQENTYDSITAAIEAWNQQNFSVGVIRILDSRRYGEQSSTLKITIPAGRQLFIIAADGTRPHVLGDCAVGGCDLRLMDASDGNPEDEIIGQFKMEFGSKKNKCAVLIVRATSDSDKWTLAGFNDAGDFRTVVIDDPNHELSKELKKKPINKCRIIELATSSLGRTPVGGNGRLVLNGLLIEGKLSVQQDSNVSRDILMAHCTLVPNKGGVVVESGKTELSIRIEHSICGPLKVPENAGEISISDSIVDCGGEQKAITGTGTGQEFNYASPVTLERCTIFGEVDVRELTLASEVIFTDAVHVRRRQIGCVRYSYVPPGSVVPRSFRCQPPKSSKVQPVFTSKSYGHPAYAQLACGCPDEILTGGENGSEMGVFNHQRQAQREANIHVNFKEYLRFGLEAGIFYVT